MRKSECFWFIWSYFMLNSFVLLWYENTCSIYFDSVLISVHCWLSLPFVLTCEFGTERFCLETLKRHTFNVWAPIYYVLKSRTQTSDLEDFEKGINPVLIQTPDRTCKVPAHKKMLIFILHVILNGASLRRAAGWIWSPPFCSRSSRILPSGQLTF